MSSENKISLASKACVLLGANEIQSFEEETTEGLAVRTFYEMVYKSVLTHRNWSFAKEMIELSLLDKKAAFGYKYVYRMKSSIVKLISLQNTATDYKLMSEREIHTNQKNAYAVALVRVDEALLPEDFKMAFVNLLAASMAMTITGESSTQARYESSGATLLKQAGTNDAVQSGNLSYGTDSEFVNGWGGGY